MIVTSEQYRDLLQEYSDKVNADATDVLIEGAKRTLIEMKSRIHNQGKATSGVLIGSLPRGQRIKKGDYSRGWANRRLSAGRQIERVDLQFDGRADFGDLTAKNVGLIGNYIVGTSGEDVVIGFVDDDQREIAEHHESYRQEPIFTSSDQETGLGIETIISIINQRIDDVFA